jgi:hypothetical protein
VMDRHPVGGDGHLVRQEHGASTAVVGEAHGHQRVAERGVLLGRGHLDRQAGADLDVDPGRRAPGFAKHQHLGRRPAGFPVFQRDVGTPLGQLPGQPQRRRHIQVPDAGRDPPGRDRHVDRPGVEHEVHAGQLPGRTVAFFDVVQRGRHQVRVPAQLQPVPCARQIVDQCVRKVRRGLGFRWLGARPDDRPSGGRAGARDVLRCHRVLLSGRLAPCHRHAARAAPSWSGRVLAGQSWPVALCAGGGERSPPA